jgi:uncharacterized protein YecA (UPF0149 family)
MISTDEAFEEYFTEGLVNEGRYAEKGSDAVKLKAGLGLQFRRQAESKNTAIPYLGEAEQKIVAPPKAGAGRYIKERITEPVQTAADALTARVIKNREDKLAKEVGAAESALPSARATVQTEEQKLSALRQKNLAEAADLRKRYDELNAVYQDRSKPRTERAKAYDVMGAYRNSIEAKAKEVEAQEKAAEDAQKKVKNLEGTASKKSATVSTASQPTGAVSFAGRAAEQAVEGRQEIGATSAQPGEGPVTINQNIKQEISQVINSAPSGLRDTLTSPLDQQLRNSVFMKKLMGQLEGGFEQLTKSNKLGKDSQKYMDKRLKDLQNHVTNDDVDAFNKSFDELKDELLNG